MRISFEKMAIKVADVVKDRSEDPYKKVGACILNEEGRILSVGYNGLLSKQTAPNNFWKDRDERRKYIIHAEINALASITRYDKPYLLACTLLPCCSCAVNIAAYGIKYIYYLEEYEKDQLAHEIFNFYKLKLINFKKI